MSPFARTAPEMDPRSADDVAREVVRLLEKAFPEWRERDSETGHVTGAGGALVAAFARLMEILIERLNLAPDKNLLAFLDLLGVSAQPPQAARVPVVFTLVAGGPERAMVPAGAQVSADPPQGGRPLTFETERALEVVAAELDIVGMREPAADAYTVRVPANGMLHDAPILFRGERSALHSLYLRHDDLLAEDAAELRLDLELNGPAFPGDPRRLRWEVWDGGDGIPLEPLVDGTRNLARSGTVRFRNVPGAPLQIVHGVNGRWVRCCLDTPATGGPTHRRGMVRDRHLPTLRRIRLRSELREDNLLPDAAFAGSVPVDLTREFFPFGDSPRFGDTCYLAQEEAFSTSGARITLKVEVVNPASGGSEPPIPRANPSPDLRLLWEAWDGERWTELGTGGSEGRAGGPHDFDDRTHGFARSGEVRFVLPPAVGSKEVNGVPAHWIRVRIAAGDYGRPAGYEVHRGEKNRLEYMPTQTTLGPPSIRSLVVKRFAIKESEAPQTSLALNDFAWTQGTEQLRAGRQSWRPFRAMQEAEPSIYLGFSTRNGANTFPGRSASVFVRVADPAPHEDVSAGAAPARRLVWEHSAPDGWKRLTLRDGTDGLRRSGIIEFLIPEDFLHREEFGEARHWIRATHVLDDSGSPSSGLRCVLLNATTAHHFVTVRDETLGSGTGLPGQRLRTRFAPVLTGQQLRVGTPGDFVPWREVPDFHGSGPGDRHYVIDRMSGEVRFGDGRRGAIPPRGRGNVKMALYRTGGGSAGNVPAGSVSKLKTTLPYIDAVINPEPAAGGADSEDLEQVRRRAGKELRHGQRAVAASDYEDIALLSSSLVARAKCVRDPTSNGSDPGRLLLVIVPRSLEPTPYPDSELVRRVSEHVGRCCPAGVHIVVRGPDYVRIDVSATLGVGSPGAAGEVELAAHHALEAFLHPLSGGEDGSGWPFGGIPERSGFQALLAELPSVSRVESLEIATVEGRPGLLEAGAFLVRSGSHRIRLALAKEKVS